MGRLPKALIVACAISAGVAVSAIASESVIDRGVLDALRKPLVCQSLLLDAVGVEGLMAAVGERGHILISRDGGQNWDQSDAPTQGTLTGVYFHDQRHGWAVGHDTLILRTDDGGESWDRVLHRPDDETPLFDVWFRNEREGYAIGAYGLFLVTSDGGTTWEDVVFSPEPLVAEESTEDESGYEDDFPEDYHLNQISRAPGGRLYIAAEAGHVYRSDDDGATWLSLSPGYAGSFFGTHAITADSVLVFGLRGNMYRSDDAGASWSQVSTNTQAMLTDALKAADGKLWIAGLGGVLLESGDDGQSFSLRQIGDRKGATTVLHGPNDALLLFGESGIRKFVPPTEPAGGAEAQGLCK